MIRTRRTATLAALLCFSIVAVSFLGREPKPYAFPPLTYFRPMPVNEANPVTTEGVRLGRSLFYDPILSTDSTISCSGCHKQENAFSDSPNLFSKGVNATTQKRNTPALFNVAWYSALFWDGRAKTIEDQVYHPVRDKAEMALDWKLAEKRINRSKFYRKKFAEAFGNRQIDSVLITKAIAQFERTLISNNSKYDRVVSGKARFSQDELEGMELVNDMTRGNCMHCHTTDGDGLGTTGQFSNNGLEKASSHDGFKDPGLGGTTKDPRDFGKFKIPSLRNLAFTAPYMHDGRFKKLEEVIDFYSEGLQVSPTVDSKMEFVHRGGSRLSAAEKRKVIAFLKTLNDYDFISNRAFSNPFIR